MQEERGAVLKNLKGFSDKGFTTRGSANKIGGRDAANDSVGRHVVTRERKNEALEPRKSNPRLSREDSRRVRKETAGKLRNSSSAGGEKGGKWRSTRVQVMKMSLAQ